MHINVLELKAVKLALMSFHRQIKNESNSFSNRQSNSLDVITKNWGRGWGYRKKETFLPNQRYMELSSEKLDHGRQRGFLHPTYHIKFEST